LLDGPLTFSSAPGSPVTVNLTLTSTNFYSGQITATCDATALPGSQCSLSPPNPITLNAVSVVPLTASINVPKDATPGTYNISINSQDVTGAPTFLWIGALTIFQDFTLGSLTPATQTITVGGSTSYNFNVLPVGSSFTNAVNLSCSGSPAISLCSFSPSTFTPGSSSVNVVMTISTSKSASLSPLRPGQAPIFYALWLALPALALLGTGGRRRKNARLTLSASLLGLFLFTLLLGSCGGGGSNGTGSGIVGQHQGTQPGTYTATVTGTSGTVGTSGYLTHQAPSVTLVVNP
jgi:hypothetical protein